MLLLRGKGSGAPFQLLTQLILFGRKKPTEEPERAPAPSAMRKLEPFPIPDTIRKTVSETDIAKARNKLRVANLERDIIGDALTKIYEAEAKGQINEPEKNPREKARNKAEEKIESIREEVLKAMERLEQIETEG